MPICTYIIEEVPRAESWENNTQGEKKFIAGNLKCYRFHFYVFIYRFQYYTDSYEYCFLEQLWLRRILRKVEITDI